MTTRSPSGKDKEKGLQPQSGDTKVMKPKALRVSDESEVVSPHVQSTTSEGDSQSRIPSLRRTADRDVMTEGKEYIARGSGKSYGRPYTSRGSPRTSPSLEEISAKEFTAPKDGSEKAGSEPVLRTPRQSPFSSASRVGSLGKTLSLIHI